MSLYNISKVRIPKITSFAAYTFRNLSRRSNNVETPYKVVKSRKSSKEVKKLIWKDPNFEILATNGFPFCMPGLVGPAWYDLHTTAQVNQVLLMEHLDDAKTTDGNIICQVQVCPTVLRQTVYNLFPNRNLENSDLSIVTISLKVNVNLLRQNKELETEKLAQTFLLTAKNICDKLRKAGYWADFINPFSGKPYLFPEVPNNNKLYEAHEKFRCLDFQIHEMNDCKVILNEEAKTKNKFIGSLFTTAPSNQYHLNSIFTK